MKSLLDHPEIKALFIELMRTLLNESDRGALLIGVEHVNNHLGGLLSAAFPASLGKKRRKELLDYPGPFSGPSARIEAAYVFRLIPRNVYDALHALRKLRNIVAHSPGSFSLRENAEQVHRIYDLGPDTTDAVRQIAAELMLEYKTDVVLKAARELQARTPDSEPLVGTKEQAIDLLRQDPELLEVFWRQVPLWELVVGISLLCSSIVHQRDKLIARLGPEVLLSDLVSGATTGSPRAPTSPSGTHGMKGRRPVSEPCLLVPSSGGPTTSRRSPPAMPPAHPPPAAASPPPAQTG